MKCSKKQKRKGSILRERFPPAPVLLVYRVSYITYLASHFSSIRLAENLILYHTSVGKFMALPLTCLLLRLMYLLLSMKLWLSSWLGKVEPLVGNFTFVHRTRASRPTNGSSFSSILFPIYFV